MRELERGRSWTIHLCVSELLHQHGCNYYPISRLCAVSKATFDVPDIMLGLGLSFLVFSTITGIQMPLFFKMGYTKAKLWSVIPFAVVMLLVVLPSFVSALSGILDFAQSHKELFAFACILTSCIIQFVSYHIAVIFYRKQR